MSASSNECCALDAAPALSAVAGPSSILLTASSVERIEPSMISVETPRPRNMPRASEIFTVTSPSASRRYVTAWIWKSWSENGCLTSFSTARIHAKIGPVPYADSVTSLRPCASVTHAVEYILLLLETT